jgi:hypothetical protein
MPLDTESFDLPLATLAPLRRRAAAGRSEERVRPRRRGARGCRAGNARHGAVRALHPGGIWRPRPVDVEEVRVALELGRTTPLSAPSSAPMSASAARASSWPARSAEAEWLPEIATGEIITSFALTEPGAGSTAPRSRPAPFATATSTGCRAANATSPMPTRPRSSPSWPAPASEGARGVPLSSCLPTSRPQRRQA